MVLEPVSDLQAWGCWERGELKQAGERTLTGNGSAFETLKLTPVT